MTDTTQAEKLQASIDALEAQRAMLGDVVVDTALVALRAQLAALTVPPPEPAPPAEQRRLISIIFTDIVGSTSLAEKMDPEEWRQIVAQLHSGVGGIIDHHHGTVAQYLGDGLLAFFGAEESREQDAENAIRAALEIQVQLAGYQQPIGDGTISQPSDLRPLNLQLRIGIHTGFVVVGELGAEAHKEFTATGDAMNLAARVQSAAPPGAILISHDTYRYVRGVFDVTPRPPLTVKGKQEPIQTYLVRRAKPRPFRTVSRGVAGIETQTVGRDREIKQLRDAYLNAFEQRRLVWAQLIGEAGVGKSRLLADTNEWIELREETVWLLRARAFSGDENQPYSTVRRMWFDRFQIAEDSPLAEAERRWVEKFLELAGTVSSDPNLGAEAAHVLGLLIGLPFSSSPYIGAMRNDPKQLQGRAFVVSRALLARLRATGPVIVLLEDLQITDASSREWLSQVVLGGPQESANGLFILGTARPEWEPLESMSSLQEGGPATYVEIKLEPLSDEATEELVHELLSRVEGVPDAVVDGIVLRAEGIPYYAEEMVNWFLDRGIIDSERDPWQFLPTRLKESPLPTTLQHLLLTRLSALSESEREALQRGAIFGRHFWTGGVQALGVPASAEVLGHLQPRGLVEAQAESSLAGETEWSFTQALLREVTYESVLKRERASLHKSAAQWLEEQARRADRIDEFAGLIAEHSERAGEMSAAADWYIRAGERAQTSSALTEARRFFDRALELLPPVDRERRWRALLGRATVLDLRGERESQKADIEALLELAEAVDDDARKAEAHYHRMRYAAAMSENQQVLSEADQAIAAARRAGNVAIELHAMGAKTVHLTRMGNLEAAGRLAEETLARAEAAGDDQAQANPFHAIAIHYGEAGNDGRAVQLFAQSIESARRLGDRTAEAFATGMLGYEYVLLGLYKMGRSTIERSLALCEAIGHRRARAYQLQNLGMVYWRTGDGRTARRLEEQASAECAAVADPFGQAACFLYLGYIVESAGDYGAGARRFSEAREGFAKLENATQLHEALAGEARCALAQGRLEEAQRLAIEIWDFLREHGGGGMECTARVYLTCAEVFEALTELASPAGSADDPNRPVRLVVEAGYRELMERANQITNAEWHKSYLENVEENRMLVEMWGRVQRSQVRR